MYFNGCAPPVCTYATITETTGFVYALTLLISLYGGLVLIFRLLVPFIINTLAKLKHRRQHFNINSSISRIRCKSSLCPCILFVGSIKNFVVRSTKIAKRLNLFKDENERTQENVRRQKLITRVYLILLSGMTISSSHRIIHLQETCLFVYFQELFLFSFCSHH